MLSRTASALYWMSRYLERAEAVARLLDVNLTLSLDLSGGEDEAWEAVVATTGDLEPFLERHGAIARGPALAFLAFDPENPNSVASCVHLARENARTVREQLPGEAWESINALHLQLRQAAQSDQGLDTLDRALDAVRSSGRQLDGLLATALTRDEGWQFSQLGQNMERADQTSRLVDVQHALLEGRGGGSRPRIAMGGRAQERQRPDHVPPPARRHRWDEGRRVPAFGRDLSTQRGLLPECGRGGPEGHQRHAARASSATRQKALGRLAADLRYTEIDDVLADGVHAWLDHFQTRLNVVGESVRLEYFEAPAAPEEPEP